MAMMPFELMGDLGSGGLFNVQTDLFPERPLQVQRDPTTREQEQLAASKRYRLALKASAFYLRPPPPPKDIERYSDRYKAGLDKPPSLQTITSNTSFFPEELHSILDPKKRVRARRDNYDQANVMRDLEALTNEAENGGAAGDEEDEDAEKEGQGSEAEEEDYEDEEDLVDENDYGQNYFDNGEADDIDDEDGDGGDYY